MKIALLGYGKMGKAIEEMAQVQGHEIVLKVARQTQYSLNNIDVAIEFSVPEMAATHIRNCLENNIPVVSGTTGWLDQYEEITALCHTLNGAFLYASNFSVGVNLFFAMTKKMAQIMADTDYKAGIEEIHHIHKLDAPSGTAITLAENVLDHSSYEQWKLKDERSDDASQKQTLWITSERTGEVPGTHHLSYTSPIDTIRLSHIAHSRAGFVQGALLAASWLEGKKGVFSMSDVLNIS